jgi:hypothetical protein
MGYISVGLVAALMMNIVDLDSESITSFTSSIISIDIALLISKIVASQQKSIIE